MLSVACCQILGKFVYKFLDKQRILEFFLLLFCGFFITVTYIEGKFSYETTSTENWRYGIWEKCLKSKEESIWVEKDCRTYDKLQLGIPGAVSDSIKFTESF